METPPQQLHQLVMLEQLMGESQFHQEVFLYQVELYSRELLKELAVLKPTERCMGRTPCAIPQGIKEELQGRVDVEIPDMIIPPCTMRTTTVGTNFATIPKPSKSKLPRKLETNLTVAKLVVPGKV